MADIFQGSALPNVNTNQSQQTTLPDWYNNYIQGLNSAGQAAQANAQFVGPTGLQNAAFSGVTGAAQQGQGAMNQGIGATQNALNMQSPLGAASGYLGQATSLNGAQAASPYINQGAAGPAQTAANAQALTNPYIQNQVAQIGQLGERNVLQNIAPQSTAGAVGSGQFGSQRGAQALGQAINDAQMNTSSLQANALQGGYSSALQSALANQGLQLNAGQTLGSLTQGQQSNLLNAGSTAGQLQGAGVNQQLAGGAQLGALGTANQAMGLTGINAMNQLGTQQQQIAQNEQLFPMQTLAMQAGLMQGAQLPTGVSSSYSGPMPGAYNPSPLAQVAGAGALATGLGSSLGSGLSSLLTTLGYKQ